MNTRIFSSNRASFRMAAGKRNRRQSKAAHARRRRLVAETLEDRNLLAVSFEFQYINDNAIGFNDPVDGSTFRSALESAADRLGNWLLHDATIQLEVVSRPFDGTAVAKATSEPAARLSEGGFVHGVIPGKLIDQVDQNGAAADGRLEVFFFDAADLFSYVTDPALLNADDEIDFQAVLIHELIHTLGFTSATNANGSDDGGEGISTPGTWTVFDQFLSDAAGNRLIDGDPQSATAFQMDTVAWATHSVGGKGPAAGLFFDGPTAHAVYGGPVPLFSPSTFFLESSVAHLDSEGFPDESYLFSPVTHLMSHAIIDGQVPQQLTLLEKAMLADLGILMTENVPPTLTPPANLVVEANARGGFLGTNPTIEAFLAAASAEDLIDPNPTVTNNKPSLLALGQNVITFTATDASGNQSTATSVISVVDTTPPLLSVAPSSVTFEATGPEGISNVALPFLPTVSDIVDPQPSVTVSGGTSFPIGTTTVTYTARDFRNNVSSQNVAVVVQDTTPPTFQLPETITIDSNLIDGADLTNPQLIALIQAAASDAADDQLQISAQPDHFPFGTTTVTFTVTDDSGNSTIATTQMTVESITLVVTTLDDELDPNPSAFPQDLSLREAIQIANERASTDHIRFADGLTGTVQLDPALGQLLITDSVTLTGLGMEATEIDAQSFSRVLAIDGDLIDIEISDLTIRGGRLIGDSQGGAGIRFDSTGSLSLQRVAVVDNVTTGTAGAGGGIYAPRGDLTLVQSLVTGNRTEGEFAGGGGLWQANGNLTVIDSRFTNNSTLGNFASAGALYVLDGLATIQQSVLTGNTTSGTRSGGGALAVVSGEAVIRDTTIAGNSTGNDNSPGGGLRSLLSPLQLINSTVSGNTAGSSSSGGGVYADRGNLTIQHSTITANQAAGSGGGVGVPAASSLSLKIENSIVAGNSDNGTAPDFVGTGVLTNDQSVRFSLIGDNTGTTLAESQTQHPTTGNYVGDPLGSGVIDPQLVPLADNGGLTPTHSLLATSPAIDAGDPNFLANTFTPPLINDQRGDGFPRIFGGRIDIGAIETVGDVVITWFNPDPIPYGTPLGPSQLNAVANLPGTFSYTPMAGTLLEPGLAQPLTATFTPDDLNNYAPTSATVFIDVTKAEPVITWNDPDPIEYGTALSEIQLSATANVPGTFTYSPPIGTILDAGDDRVLSVVFVPDDTDHYKSVADAVLIDVIAVEPVLTWNNPTDITYGTPLSSTQLNATANVPGSFFYVPPAGVLLNAGPNQTLTVTFTPTSTNYEPISATVKINVNKATPEIVWTDPVDIVVGTALSAAQLNATSNVSGAFVYDPPLGTVLNEGQDQVLNVTFTPDNLGNYNQATKFVLLDVIPPHDFGDAPDIYPVLLAQNGARHLPGSLLLGSSIDLDLDGQPSADAGGDGDDEDGVQLIADPVATAGSQTTASWTVQVSDTGKLDAWIDFNQDGDWSDPGEQVHASVALAAGTHLLSFPIPAGSMAGTTFARFRVSTAGGLSPTGAAADGEVEDHPLNLLAESPSATAAVQWIDTVGSVSLGSGSVIVEQGGIESFRAPLDSLGALSVLGLPSNQSLQLHLASGQTLPPNGIAIDGGNGGNTLRLHGDQQTLDLTDPSLQLSRFRHFDLTSADANQLVVDVAAVDRLSPMLKVLEIVWGAEDSLTVNEASDWRITEPLLVDGRFVLTATHRLGGGETIRADSPRPWQNFLRAGDVNNDGLITAADALRIINELGRREYSDAVSQSLVNPLAVAVWPGDYFDHSGDGRVSALDALRVINDLSRQSLAGGAGEGEALLLAADATSQETLTCSVATRLDTLNGTQPITNAKSAGATAGDGSNRLLASGQAASSFGAEDQPGSDDESIASAVDELLANGSFLDQLLP